MVTDFELLAAAMASGRTDEDAPAPGSDRLADHHRDHPRITLEDVIDTGGAPHSPDHNDFVARQINNTVCDINIISP